MADSQGEPEVWWFNIKTLEAELGRKTNSIDRIGPFATEVEALKALETLARRSNSWREEDEADT